MTLHDMQVAEIKQFIDQLGVINPEDVDSVLTHSSDLFDAMWNANQVSAKNALMILLHPEIDINVKYDMLGALSVNMFECGYRAGRLAGIADNNQEAE